MPKMIPRCKKCHNVVAEFCDKTECCNSDCIWHEHLEDFTIEWVHSDKERRIAYLIGALEYISPYDMMDGVEVATQLIHDYEDLTGKEYPKKKEVLYIN